MFEQTRAFRIRFQLPESQIGKIREIRTIPFDAAGIHTFEGTYEEFITRQRYLRAHGCVALEVPDMSTPADRPLPTGVGKHKVANVAGARDDLDDVSAFKVKPNVPPVSAAPQGDGKSPVRSDGAGAESATDLQQRSGATSADGPAARAPAGSEPIVGAEDQIDDADFSL